MIKNRMRLSIHYQLLSLCDNIAINRQVIVTIFNGNDRILFNA